MSHLTTGGLTEDFLCFLHDECVVLSRIEEVGIEKRGRCSWEISCENIYTCIKTSTQTVAYDVDHGAKSRKTHIDSCSILCRMVLDNGVVWSKTPLDMNVLF